mgnify:CR=1 FL=1|jgi:hypothetical protein
MLSNDEWTQKDYLEEIKNGTKVLLIDIINKGINGVDTVLYNPYILKKEDTETIFLFYCDTGKVSKERLIEFKNKFPAHEVKSLRGGRSYWNKYLN